MEWLEGLNCDYLPHPQHEPSISVRYKWVGGVACVCVTYIYNHAEVMLVACGTVTCWM